MRIFSGIIVAAALALAACGTTGTVKEIETRDVVVTRTEKSIEPAELERLKPPPPMAARPSSLSAALDLALAKLCEWVGYADKADPLLQNAAGVSLGDRVTEPICKR